MRIFMTGATGLIGRRLVVDRLSRGDDVVILSRNAQRAAQVFAAGVNPRISILEGDCAVPGDWQRDVDGSDALIHLAGANLSAQRWTDGFKRELVQSRVDSTFQVVQAIEMATRQPEVFISASAIGYYGESGDCVVDETTPPGQGFLPDLCVRWEEQARAMNAHGTRTVLMRTGLVFDRRGGALKKMMPLFRSFLGGPIGIRNWWNSWIHYRDLIGLFNLALRDPDVEGPLNATSPNPATNWEIARALGRAMGRPWFFAAPRFAVRLAIGEMARHAFVSQRVFPDRAEQAGYQFVYPEIGHAIDSILEPSDQNDAGASRSFVPLKKTKTKIAGPKPPSQVRLLAIDVDGTLLRSDKSLAKGVVQACRSVNDEACCVMLATGRTPGGIRGLLQQLDLTGPAICFHGGVIWNPIDNLPLYHEILDGQTTSEVIDLARAAVPKVFVGLEILNKWYTDRHLSVDGSGLLLDGLSEPDAIGDLQGFTGEGVSRLSLYGDPEQLAAAVASFSESHWKTRRVGVFHISQNLVQVVHPLVDKGIALQRIAKRMNIDKQQVMAIGDGINDAGMIDWAGFGVAVENAHPSVLSIADVVVPSNDDHGVARAIQRYVLNEHPPVRETGQNGQA